MGLGGNVESKSNNSQKHFTDVTTSRIPADLLTYHFNKNASDAPDVNTHWVELATQKYFRCSVPKSHHLSIHTIREIRQNQCITWIPRAEDYITSLNC
jgi:hypothetical protein